MSIDIDNVMTSDIVFRETVQRLNRICEPNPVTPISDAVAHDLAMEVNLVLGDDESADSYPDISPILRRLG